MNKSADKNLTIGYVSKLKNISAQTLRYYDKIGLLSPDKIDETNNYRYYTREQLILIDKIKFLKILGLSLEEIKEFQSITDLNYLLYNLKEKHFKLKDQIKKLEIIEGDLSTILKNLDNVYEMKTKKEFPIHLTTYDPILGVVLPFNGSKGWLSFEEILGNATRSCPSYSDINHNYGISFIADKKDLIDSKEKNIKKVIIPIKAPESNDKNKVFYPLGTCVVGYHLGKFNGFNDTYQALNKFIGENNLKVRGDIHQK